MTGTLSGTQIYIQKITTGPIIKNVHIINRSQMIPIAHGQYNQNLDEKDAPQHYNNTTLQSQIPTQARVVPSIKEIAIVSKNASKNHPLAYNRNATIAPASTTISKQKVVKRTYQRKQPNKSSTEPKFAFPLPPPKIDFKVSTNTPFMTTIDNTRTETGETLTTLDAGSSRAAVGSTQVSIMETECENSPLLNGIYDFNGAPLDCMLFKKLTIDTTKGKNSESSIHSESFSSEVKDISQNSDGFANVERDETMENSIGSDDVTIQSEAAPVVEPVTEQTEYGEIIKRLGRVEALQLASAKRDSQILIAVKKLCMAYTKHNDDNEEIKKLLPSKNLLEVDALNTRLIEDSVFEEKVRAYMRGFKTSNSPENFSSLLSVCMIDEVVDQFNYKGILGKHKLEEYKCIGIIKDLHKPLDPKTFDKLMRITIDLAKNRYHNEQYRKRQLLKKQNNINSEPQRKQ